MSPSLVFAGHTLVGTEHRQADRKVRPRAARVRASRPGVSRADEGACPGGQLGEVGGGEAGASAAKGTGAPVRSRSVIRIRNRALYWVPDQEQGEKGQGGGDRTNLGRIRVTEELGTYPSTRRMTISPSPAAAITRMVARSALHQPSAPSARKQPRWLKAEHLRV